MYGDGENKEEEEEEDNLQYIMLVEITQASNNSVLLQWSATTIH